MMRIDLSWEDEENRKAETVPEAQDTADEAAEAPAEPTLPPERDAGFPGKQEEVEEHIRQEIRADLDNSESAELPSPEEILASNSEEAPLPGEAMPGESDEAPLSGETPVIEEDDFRKYRRPSSEGEKVPLSDFEPNAVNPLRAGTPFPEESISSPEPPNRRPRGMFALLAGLLALMIMLAGGILYLKYGDAISRMLFGSRNETASVSPEPSGPVEEPAPAPADSTLPAPAPSAPESTAVAAKPEPVPAPSVSAPRPAVSPPARSVARPRPVAPPDPAVAVLDRISKVTPARVWLTAETAGADGTYEIEGMAFTHDALLRFVSALEKSGTVTAKNIPPEATSPDTVYRFTAAGKFSGINAPGVLGPVSPEQLSALAGTLRALLKSSGMTIIREPRPGTVYGDDELPFEVEGSYSGVAAFLGKLVSKGKFVVYQVSIQPAVSGRPFNRVRVSFSVRTPS
jgi:hypothetical protein